ncbi:MAG TPA: AMP-binding protein [Streptosporangiaceae bacterium]|nr:AMP-binding protein [Streptosporangiaceae bacterium]
MIAGSASRRAVAAAGDRVLLIAPDGRTATGREVEDATLRLAVALARHGLAGQRIGLWSWNCAAAIEAHLATEWIGATRVPVDPGAPAAEAAAVFAAAKVAGVIADAAHAADAPAGALVHDEDERLSAPGTLEAREVDGGATHLLYPRMAAQGEFLAVPISYANWAACMEINAELYRGGGYGAGFDAGEVFLTAQQIMHGTGMLGTFPFLHMGLPQVILPRFDAAAVLEAAQRHRATATFFVPGMVTRLADAVADAGLPAAGPLRRILYGGAPIAAADLNRATQILGPVLVQVYGRFEGGWPLAVLGTGEHRDLAAGRSAHAGSCGRPIPQTELRIRPAAGQAAGEAAGQDAAWGELCVRNGMVVADWADPDGWCGLGDLARLDGDGYLYLGGRLDGMINTGSYHVYPREVEEAMTALPFVAAALVRGEADPTWGQAVTGYVVAAPGAPGDLAGDLAGAVRAALRQRLASYKIPKRIIPVPTLDDL